MIQSKKSAGTKRESSPRLFSLAANLCCMTLMETQMTPKRMEKETGPAAGIKRTEKALAALSAISQSVNQSLELDQVLNVALEKVMELFKPHSADIRLLDSQTQELVSVAQKGLSPDQLREMAPRLKSGKSVSVMARNLGEVVVFEDISSDPRVKDADLFAGRMGCRSLVVLPLYAKDKLVGTLSIRALAPKAYRLKELKYFKSIGHLVGMAIENAHLFAQLQQRAQALSTLNNISQTVNQSLNLDTTLNSALENVLEALNVDAGLIRLLDEGSRTLKIVSHQGFTPDQIEKMTVSRKYGSGLAWDVYQTGQVQFVTFDPSDSFQQKMGSFGMRIGARNVVLFPLKTKDKPLGAIALYTFTPRQFSEHEIDMCGIIGNQVGAAIENARLYQEKEATIQTLQETRGELQQAQKMEAIGTLAGGIAHDFNNILSIVLGNTELAMFDVPDWNPAYRHLEKVRTACLRARDVVTQILAFSRQNDKEFKPVDVGPIIKESIKLLRSSIPTTIEIQQNISETPATVLADATQINQVLINLCTNAAHAMKESGGVLSVGLEHVTLDEVTAARYHGLNAGHYVRLTVSDTGHGIEPEILKRIFEPYFTTKKVGEGSGLGLAVVHGIVKSYQGDIIAGSEAGKGTTFQVYIPRINAAPETPVQFAIKIPGGNERILLVDDEPSLVNAIRPILERLGYQVVAKSSSIEALEAFRASPDSFDLVITDFTMPNMSGMVLSEGLLKLRPETPVILCTGYSDQVSEEKAKAMGIRSFIMKPVVMSDLAQMIRKVLDDR